MGFASSLGSAERAPSSIWVKWGKAMAYHGIMARPNDAPPEGSTDQLIFIEVSSS